MKFKTELHCHSANVSACASISDEELVSCYEKNGYNTIVLTNHYSVYTFERLHDASWEEKNTFFINGYKSLLKEAKGRISILLGMEYRNIYTANDYLVYGMTEEFIRQHNRDDEHNLLNMHLKEFVSLAHENNMLVFQAHPFRDGMTVVNPSKTDGIEILNGHAGHDSRNDIASAWAKKYDLLTCGGSDCHFVGDEARVALITDEKITNSEKLVEILKTNVRDNLEGAGI